MAKATIAKRVRTNSHLAFEGEGSKVSSFCCARALLHFERGRARERRPRVKLDVKKFFPSVSRAVIFRFFEGPLKCRRDVAGLLADILTYKSHLPTGGAASPIIAYYSFKEMFD